MAKVGAFLAFCCATLPKNAQECLRGPAVSWGVRSDVTAAPGNFEPSGIRVFFKTWKAAWKSSPKVDANIFDNR